jgi:carbamoyl-phosphate synthase/aspartate carbamoyltransferase/dihydroorotase
VGGTKNNARALEQAAPLAAGLKLYLDATYGPLLLEELSDWMAHFEYWPQDRPLAAHAEGKTLAAFLQLAEHYQRPVHVCHVSRKEEILLIREAKRRGTPVTCEVAPQHLFLTNRDVGDLGETRARVKPDLAEPEDQQALWDNLEVIDCLATDHAPHTLEEKDSPQAPPGFPGLETALPLMLTAVHQGRLTMDKLVDLSVVQPRKIFRLPEQPDTWVEIDPDWKQELKASALNTRCGWTPFEGFQVRGGVRKVFLRGRLVFEDGEILAEPGTGWNIRKDIPTKPH